MPSLDTSPNSALAARVPVYQDYMNPILEALRSADRPLAIEELEQRVAQAMGLAAEVVAIPHDPEVPDRSEVGYRMWFSPLLDGRAVRRADLKGLVG